MNRIRGFIIFAIGLVLLVLGLGMWRSAELNWESFVAVWSLIADNAVRLVRDPFTILGVLVMIVGLLILISGFRRLVRG